MKNIKSFNTARKAGVTVEVAIAIVLAVSVLFLVLGLFSDNLKTMADNTGFNNLVKKDTSTVTANTNLNKNYTDSVVNVQIAGQQGLQWYMDDTQKRIDVLNAKSQTTPVGTNATGLTAAEQTDLLKYIMVKTMLADIGLSTGVEQIDESKLIDKNGLPIDINDRVSYTENYSPVINSPTQPNGKRIVQAISNDQEDYKQVRYRYKTATTSDSKKAAEQEFANYITQVMANCDKAKAALSATGN